MKKLLDTCTISEMKKSKPDPKVTDWIYRAADVDLYLSVVTVGEICKGIEKQRAKNVDDAQRLTEWLENLKTHYAARILPLDLAAAQIWGRLMAQFPSSGVEDAQIAAIAMQHGMTVITLNVRDFAPFGVPIINPF